MLSFTFVLHFRSQLISLIFDAGKCTNVDPEIYEKEEKISLTST